MANERALALVMALLTPQVAVAQDKILPAGARSTFDDRSQAIECMTSAIVHEAGFEPIEGEEAVAEVILNRVHSPAFPKTICSVVFQGSERKTGCQFSFTCDGSLRKSLPVEAIERARLVATRAVNGLLTSRIPGATHYHADYVAPFWAPTLIKIGAIGRHIFYREPGAAPFSNLGPYTAAGAELANTRGSPTLGGLVSSATSNAVATEPQPFLPWGLVPGASQPPKR